MLFDSVEFAVFIPIVFVVYWFFVDKNLNIQNSFLVAVSYFFYACWDWRFLSLIIFSSFVDFLVGKELGRTKKIKKRKLLLYASIFINLGLLGFFKYFNFFSETFVETFSLLGFSFEVKRLNIVLPVGISFYTFQTLSYSIDVYKGKIKPTKNIIEFFAFVSFFPQLVAGPIERATNLLPQFFQKRNFEYQKAVDGLRQILSGLFKKLVIADNCAYYVDQIFPHFTDFSSLTLIFASVLFAFQIYGDFSGYSDIAIGVSRLFGFNLMQNFAFPYFSRNIAEFWRRWHISLSTWFRDYLYIPLGGSRGTTWKKIRNILIIFIVSGFWHGAEWTFIFWGLINAIYFLPLMLQKKNRMYLDVVAKGRILPTLRELIKILTTFSFTVIAWIFFRSKNLGEAFSYLKLLFTVPSLQIFMEDIKQLSERNHIIYFLSVLSFFVVVEWFQRNKQHILEFSSKKNIMKYRWVIYYFTISIILYFLHGGQNNFIYFQF